MDKGIFRWPEPAARERADPLHLIGRGVIVGKEARQSFRAAAAEAARHAVVSAGERRFEDARWLAWAVQTGRVSRTDAEHWLSQAKASDPFSLERVLDLFVDEVRERLDSLEVPRISFDSQPWYLQPSVPGWVCEASPEVPALTRLADLPKPLRERVERNLLGAPWFLGMSIMDAWECAGPTEGLFSTSLAAYASTLRSGGDDAVALDAAWKDYIQGAEIIDQDKDGNGIDWMFGGREYFDLVVPGLADDFIAKQARNPRKIAASRIREVEKVLAVAARVSRYLRGLPPFESTDDALMPSMGLLWARSPRAANTLGTLLERIDNGNGEVPVAVMDLEGDNPVRHAVALEATHCLLAQLAKVLK